MFLSRKKTVSVYNWRITSRFHSGKGTHHNEEIERQVNEFDLDADRS